MNVELVWDNDEETVVRWIFSGFIGTVDYIMPMNDTAGRTIMADGNIGAIIDIGWKMPFPNRAFKYLHQAIMVAPSELRVIVIVCKNLFSRLVIGNRLIKPYPELKNRLTMMASLNAARRYIREELSDA